VDHIEQLNRTPGFVRLKMPDEVPLEVQSLSEGRDFALGLLYAILSELADSCVHRLLNGLNRKSLADCKKQNVVGGTAAGGRGIRDSFPYQIDVECNSVHFLTVDFAVRVRF